MLCENFTLAELLASIKYINFRARQNFSSVYNYNITKTPSVSNIRVFDIPKHFSSIVVVFQHPLTTDSRQSLLLSTGWPDFLSLIVANLTSDRNMTIYAY
jgi:hypothetical protein